MRSDSFSKIMILLFSLAVAVLFFLNYKSLWDIPKVDTPLAKLMFFYLYFICARIIVLLGFSFYEYLFKKGLPEINSFPLVSVIIPAYNEEKVIQNSIRSVSEINYPNLEILVVDDGSTDNTFVNAKEIEDELHVRVLLKENGGKSSALNLGIEEALGEYVLCVDADSKLDRDVLLKSLPYFQENEKLAAVAGNVRVGNVKNLLGLFQKLEYIIGLNFHKMAQSALNAVTIIPGPIGVFKKEAIQKVGGYDRAMFAEDCDLTLQLLMYGYDVKYASDVIAVTEVPLKFNDLIKQRYRWSRGTAQAIIKNIKTALKKKGGVRVWSILGYMMLETIFIPTTNFVFAMSTIVYALHFTDVALYGPFFIGLTLMDAILALYSIITENEIKMLFFLAILGRITYGFFLEILRFFSMLDEILSLPMKWGKLERKGME